MEWLIDGYNVLIGNDLGHDRFARERFRKKVEAHFFGKQVGVNIVYDSRSGGGVESHHTTGEIREIYVRDADGYIVDRIQSSRHPRSIILVTNDIKDIVSAVRGRGCRIVPSEEFLALISPPSAARARPEEKPFTETPENIERYRRIFEEE